MRAAAVVAVAGSCAQLLRGDARSCCGVLHAAVAAAVHTAVAG